MRVCIQYPAPPLLFFSRFVRRRRSVVGITFSCFDDSTTIYYPSIIRSLAPRIVHAVFYDDYRLHYTLPNALRRILT